RFALAAIKNRFLSSKIYTEECHFFVDPIRRPCYFDFDGAWLFGRGVGIHILQSTEPEKLLKKTKINPKDNHISFQCESMGAVEKKLKEMEIEYVRAVVEEGGIQVDQLFFHDPDGFMIEICNCDSLPVIPLAGEMARSCSHVNIHQLVQPPQIHPETLVIISFPKYVEIDMIH
ncbi:hypothetical protein N665_2060s0003, partial [Sinapis alba]